MPRRLSKEEKELLERQSINNWLAARWDSLEVPEAVELPRVQEQPLVEEPVQESRSPFLEQLEGSLSPFGNVSRTLALTPFGTALASLSPEVADMQLGVGGTLADIVGTAVDALSPDPHALAEGDGRARALGVDNLRQTLADVALSSPSAARNLLEWAGLENASRSLGVHGVIEALEERATPALMERLREAEAIEERRAEAGLPSTEELRRESVFNRAADTLSDFSRSLEGVQSPGLQAGRQALGQAIEGGVGDTARFLATEQGLRTLVTGVLPEAAAYAIPQMGVARAGRLAGLSPTLSQTSANMLTAYTVAQQNAEEVRDGILSLEPEEALANPVIAAEFERLGNLDAAKSVVANRARLETLAGSAYTSWLYSLDSFSRLGAGVRAPAAATLQRRVGSGLAREVGGEYAQGASEAVVTDLGRLAAGQITPDEVGRTAAAQGFLEAVAAAPLGAGASYAQASTEFDDRARRLEETADLLDAVYAMRDIEAAAREAEAPVQEAAEPVAPEMPDDVRQAQEDAAWEIRQTERAREENWNTQRVSLERRVDTAREDAEAFQDRVDAGDTSQSALSSLTAALAEQREAERLLNLHMEQDPSARTSEMSPRQEAEEVVEEVDQEAEAARAAREAALEEAAAFDKQEQERGDKEARKRLADARGKRTRARRAAMAAAREANANASPEERAAAIADAAAEFDAANPEPTLESISAAEAPRRPSRPRREAPAPRPRPRAAEAVVQEEAVAELSPELQGEPVPEDRREALRQRYGRAQEARAEGEPEGKSAADVVRELAKRVRKGTSKPALEAEALLSGGKLSIVDPEVMATVGNATERTQGYYDGERMYINAAELPAGDPVGVMFDSVLAHEADHAARTSQNPDAVSKVGVLLEDGPRQKLIEQLETSAHPTAVAAREALVARGIDKETNPALYEDEIVAYAINDAIERGGRSWAPIRGLVSAARRKWKEFTGSDDINLDDLGHYARSTVGALAESEAGIRANTAGMEQAAPDVAAMQAEAERMAQESGLATAQAMVEGTATRTAENVRLPVELLQRIPGTIAESRGPGDRQYDQLLAAVESDGFRNDRPIDVRVNHRGEAYIVDGNTRVAVAAERGLTEIPANVQWMNGAENVESVLSPDVVSFEGRAQEAAAATAAAESQVRGPYVRSWTDDIASAAKNAFTVYGTVGERVGRLFQEANYARDAIYQTAVHRYHRVGPAMEKAAAKAMAKEEGTPREKLKEFNQRILDRLDKIAKLPNETVKDNALARLVQEHPDLGPLVDAIHDINAVTDQIISSRFANADVNPLTEQEWQLYDYMHRNKYGYLTNVYALFQGKDGQAYADAVLRAGAQGIKLMARGEQIPDNIRRLYQVYDDAISFVMNNDVAVNDPEHLAALSLKDVSELYDRWMPDGVLASDLATQFREDNDGVLDSDSYKAYMEDAVARHVSMLKDPEYVAEDGSTGAEILRNQADAVVAALLRQDSTALTGPLRRYGRARGIDTSILEHRQNLPEEIANLYGKVNDIPSLINATLSRQGELASRLNFFNKLAEEAYGDAVISAADRNLRGNENFTVRLSGPSFGRLNGMYTTPEVAARLADYGTMFSDLLDTLEVVGVNPSLGRRWMEHRVGKAWTSFAGTQKAMKIITRPDYTLLNLAGSFSAVVLVGGVKPAHLLTGMKVALEHLALQIDPKGRTIPAELSAAHQLALQTGAFDNAVTQELRRAPRKLVNRLLDEMTSVDSISEARRLLKRAAAWTNDRGWQTLVEAYSLADTWVKLPVLLERMDYLESYYRANGDSVTNEQIQEEAARFMRDATISMDNVPGLAKFLERGGFSFYLPYFASVFRVLGKSFTHTVDSIEMAVNAKTPEARWIAQKDVARKVAGNAVVWGVALQGLKYVSELGMDEEDLEQMERDRELMYDEPKYGDLRLLGTNDQGHRQYLLTSRSDQFGPAFDILREMNRAGSVQEALSAIPKGVWDLWVANRVVLATIDHVAKGGKNTQLERSFPEATEFVKSQANKVPGGYATADFALTQLDLVSPAGVINYFDPRNKTPTEVSDNAGAIISAIAAVTGHRLVTANPEAAIKGKSRELAEHRNAANRKIRDSINNLGPQQGFKTFVAEAKRERALVEELGKMYQAMIDSGMSRRTLEEYMEGLDAKTISNLRKRAYTSETDSWIRKNSGLLSTNSIDNPPRFPDLPDEERKEKEREWKKQAREVRRMIRTLNNEENK